MSGIAVLRTSIAGGAALVVVAALGAVPARADVVGAVTLYQTGLTAGATPTGIAAGPNSSLWFTESAGNRIGQITPTGTITEYGTGLSAASQPAGITAGPDGNLWFTEYLGNRIGRITPTGAITEFGTGMSPNALPLGIAAGPDGNLWFTEQNGNRIGRITPTGTITEFSTGMSPSAFPVGITAGPDGNLWFTESGANRIGRITPTGTITEFSTGMSPSAYPNGITAGPDGNLWFTEYLGNRIGRITPNGTITEFSTGMSPSAFPSEISAGPDGNLWFTEQNGNRIARITPTGTITEFSGLTSAPAGISAGSDGNLWFTEPGDNRIGRIASGKPAPLQSQPSVTGTLQAGLPQQCTGERWDPWNGEQPGATDVTWVLDGAPTGVQGREFTPAPADIGKTLACSLTAVYPMPRVTVSASSAPVTVLPPSPAAKVQLITCTVKTKNHAKQRKRVKKCTTRLVADTVTLKGSRKAKVRQAALLKGGNTYPAKAASGKRRLRILTAAVLPAGRYRLVVRRQVLHVRIR